MEPADTADDDARHDPGELPEIESITANRGFIPESRAAWWPWKRKANPAGA